MKGFSLIELLVVIMIVAILAAFAVPIYNKYQQSARWSSIAKTVGALADRSIEYSQIHGHFANAAELGLPRDPNNLSDLTAADPAAISPYLLSISISDAGSCGGYGTVQFFVKPELLGGGAASLNGELGFYHIKPVIKKYANFYATNPAGNPITSTVIQGWKNQLDDDAYPSDLGSFTCQ